MEFVLDFTQRRGGCDCEIDCKKVFAAGFPLSGITPDMKKQYADMR